MNRRSAVAFLSLIMLSAVAPLPAVAQSDPLAPLRFLVGDWQAINSPPGESGGFSFTPGVQNHVLLRSNHAVYEATATRPASRHEDLMVIFDEGGGLKADYFDNEGHVIHYDVESRRDREVVFHCAPTAKEPGYRLSYVLLPEGLLKGQFDVSPPGTSAAFKTYLSWTARRVGK